MPTKPSKFSKNTLKLDILVHQSHQKLVYWVMFVIAVGMLAWQIGMMWWQWMLLTAIVVVLSWLYMHCFQVVWIGCAHTDGLWQIDVKKGMKQELWQAYLLSIHRAVGANEAVVIRFYVIEPAVRYVDVMVHRHNVMDEDFRKLLGLCTLYSDSMND